MALTDSQKANILFKKLQGKGTTNVSRQFFEEPRDGRQIVLPSDLWADAASIPSTAPGGVHEAITGVVKRFIDVSLTAVAGTTNSFYSDDLIDAIPFNFGDGSYNYVVKDNTDASIAFGQGDWVVDNAAGVLTFFGTVPSNMPPKISFYKYVGSKGVSGISALVSAVDADLQDLKSTGGQLTKHSFTYDQFSDASTSFSVLLTSLVAKGYLAEIIMRHTASFAGTGITAVTAEVGVLGETDKHLSPFDVFQGLTDTLFKTGGYAVPENFVSATNINITLKSTGANLDQLSAGAVDVWILTRVLP